MTLSLDLSLDLRHGFPRLLMVLMDLIVYGWISPPLQVFGQPTDGGIFFSAILFGRLVSYIVDRRARKAHAQSLGLGLGDVVPTSSEGTAVGTDASPKNAQTVTIHPLTLHFSCEEVELEYTCRVFTDNYALVCGFCSAFAGFMVLFMVAFPQPEDPLLKMLLVTLLIIIALVRRMLNRSWVADQRRAQYLFEWAVVSFFLAAWVATHLLRARLAPKGGVHAFGHTEMLCLLGIWVWWFATVHHLVPSLTPRLATAAIHVVAYSLLDPHFSALSALHERVLTGVSMLLAAFCGYSLQAHDRRCYLRHLRHMSAQEAIHAAQVHSETMRVQAELAAYVFHELRNDSNVTVGTLECIAESLAKGEGSLPPAVFGLINDGLAHAHHAVRVIANMLDFTKARAGKLKLPSEPFEVSELLQGCVQLAQHLVESRPVKLQTDCPQLHVVGSPFHLQQLVLNLLTNACKYTDEGFVRLSVEVTHEAGHPHPHPHPHPHEEPGHPHNPHDEAGTNLTLQFAVVDTGRGVHPSRRETIFEPYEQVVHSLTH